MNDVRAQASGVGGKPPSGHSDTEYTEVLATYRHYSNLRFAMMTVYFGGTAGLAAGYFTFDLLKLDKGFIAAGGIGLTFVFAWLERLLNDHLTEFGTIIETRFAASHMNQRPPGKWSTKWIVLSPYIAIAFFWAFKLTQLWR